VGQLPRRPALLHVANSAAAMRGPRYGFDMIRPGVFLYGGSAGPGLPAPRPVVSLRARVLAVRRVAAGESVSYGALWSAPAATRVATLGIGYADGVRRSLGISGRGAALLGGARCPLVGAVTMDLTMVEIGDRHVAVGDIATLIGEAEGGRIRLEEYAGWGDELHREVLTSLGPRLPRVYD
jgi:alanine racemase